MWQLGFVHQSNGESNPLSRSWNRLYGLVGVEKGTASATLRLEARADTGGGMQNDNPDIVHFLGRSELRVDWSAGAATAALAWRPAPSGRGSLRLDWSFPVNADRPDGLRWYVQAFEGYGETLVDYNFRQSSLGLGLSIVKF
jgi:phospholipase A1